MRRSLSPFALMLLAAAPLGVGILALSGGVQTAHAEHAENQATAPRVITVTGQGKASATPDMAILRLGVRSEAATAAAALKANSADMSATVATLKKLNVKAKDIQTSGLSISPRYDYSRDGSPPRLTGYVASNSVSVKLRDLDSAGRVIDQAVGAGANSIDSISLDFSDPAPLRDAARKDAVARARAKAQLLTDAAGVKLGRVLSINEGFSAPSPKRVMMAASARMEADAVPPIETGESTVAASVTIVYEIE